MKNKSIYFLIASLFLLSSYSSVLAIFTQDSSRSAFKENIKENRASLSAEIKAKRDEFKLKLQTIRDTRKQEKVDRVNSRLPEINKKRTDEMTAILDRLQNVLGRIEEKVKQGNQSNQGNLLALITTAQSAIDAARATVLTQSQKTYVVTITTEGELRITVGQTVSGMEQDLRLTREKVISARKAVKDAFAELMRLKGEKEATGSATKL